MLKNIAFLALLFITVFSSGSVRAGYEYNTAFNSGTMVIMIPEGEVQVFPRDFYGIRAIRDPYNPASKLTLRFFSLGNVTGCAKMTDFVAEVKVKNKEVAVSATDSELELKREKTRYTNHDCETELNESYFDVPLSVDDLIKNEVKRITVRSKKYGNFVELKVDVKPTLIIFSSRSNPIPGMPAVSVKMHYWLYPPRTVILSAPAAKTGENVIQSLKNFGETKGLKPLDNYLYGFRLSENETNYYFFLDTRGDLRDSIKTPQDQVVIGKMKITRPVYTAKGTVQEPVMLDVHASMPGEDQ